MKVHFEKSIQAVRFGCGRVRVGFYVSFMTMVWTTFKICLERIQNRGNAHRTLTASNDSEMEEAREILMRLISGRQPFREIEMQLNKILKSPLQKFDLNICLKPQELLRSAADLLRTRFKLCRELIVSDTLIKQALESSFDFERKLSSSSSSKSNKKVMVTKSPQRFVVARMGVKRN